MKKIFNLCKKSVSIVGKQSGAAEQLKQLLHQFSGIFFKTQYLREYWNIDWNSCCVGFITAREIYKNVNKIIGVGR